MADKISNAYGPFKSIYFTTADGFGMGATIFTLPPNEGYVWQFVDLLLTDMSGDCSWHYCTSHQESSEGLQQAVMSCFSDGRPSCKIDYILVGTIGK